MRCMLSFGTDGSMLGPAARQGDLTCFALYSNALLGYHKLQIGNRDPSRGCFHVNVHLSRQIVENGPSFAGHEFFLYLLQRR